MNRVRVAVVGAGYLGRFHAQKFQAADQAELIAVCDLDSNAGRSVAAETGAEFGQFFLEAGVHTLIEKPLTETSAQAAILTRLAEQRGLKLQVGHIERFNPALVAARQGLERPMFIECHRLAPFKPRSIDVDVVLDLMIHDLDVILSLVPAEPATVSAVGIAVLTDRADVANARIEFENGAIANVTASRASTRSERKFRVWQDQHYVAIDFGAGSVRKVVSNTNWQDSAEPLSEQSWNLEKSDALQAEVEAFLAAIIDDAACVVSGHDGVAALELAERIMADIERRRART
jgi:predicted dehydrogenase